jgi:ABC-type nitrate/sulfonate/bicarbonate transport system substrate-binding protein
LAGDIAISAQNSQVVADSGLAGGDLVAIGAAVNMVPFYMMSTPEIRTIADLKGKSVGISRFGAASDFGTRMFLAKHGLEANKDVAFVQIGGQPEIAAALAKNLSPPQPCLSRWPPSPNSKARGCSLTWSKTKFLSFI